MKLWQYYWAQKEKGGREGGREEGILIEHACTVLNSMSLEQKPL